MFGLLSSSLMHLQGGTKHLAGLFMNVATVMIVALPFLTEALIGHTSLDKRRQT